MFFLFFFSRSRTGPAPAEADPLVLNGRNSVSLVLSRGAQFKETKPNCVRATVVERDTLMRALFTARSAAAFPKRRDSTRSRSLEHPIAKVFFSAEHFSESVGHVHGTMKTLSPGSIRRPQMRRRARIRPCFYRSIATLFIYMVRAAPSARAASQTWPLQLASRGPACRA